MRVSQATINFYLKTSKVLSDGTHPIMLRVCYHGFKDVSTHYSCSKKYWDSSRQIVKKNYPNASICNYELSKLKQKIINKRDEYIRLGIEYTPSMLLSNDDDAKRKNPNVVSQLIKQYYSEKALKSGTIKAWKHSSNMIEEFHKGCIVTELTEGFCKRYAQFLKVVKHNSEGVIRNKLGHIACIYRYACELGLADINRYPFRTWNYCRQFKLSQRMQFIHQKSIAVMKEYFLSKVIEITSLNQNRFTFKDINYCDYKNRLFALYFWLLGYLFQGLSPIDICLLKKSDFKVITINGEDYYSIDTSRKKTNVSVKIRIKMHTIYSQVMIRGMLMFNQSEWFLPIMNGLGDNEDEKKYITRVRCRMSYWMNSRLKDWFKEINQVIIKKNVDEGTNIPLIDEDCTYYSFRHSFAQAFMQRGGSPMALATLMGRSENTLSLYLQQLTQNDDLIEAVSVMDD